MDIKNNARLLAAEILARIEKYDAYANIAFDAVVIRAKPSSKTKSLAKEILFGVLRHKSRLIKAVSQYMKHPFSQTHPSIQRHLLIAAYQILFLDKVPNHAAVDEAIKAVKLNSGKSQAGFVNAVLRRLVDNGENLPINMTLKEQIIIQESFPEWLAQIFIDTCGEQALNLAHSLNKRARTILRTNTLINSREELLNLLNENFPDSTFNETILSVFGLEAFKFEDPIRQPLHRQGHYLIQDEGSQLVSCFVDPQKGEKILDACAGTGGKTLHMAALTETEAVITAVDKKQSKMDALTQRSLRAGASKSVKTMVMDITQQQPEEKFDRILLDAPCSGLGVLRRHPEAKWRIQQSDLDNLIKIQSLMLDSMTSILKPGGVLVYIVCTFNMDETINQIDRFLQRHSDFELLPPPDNNLTNWEKVTNDRGMLSLYPHLHNTDGFFGARLKKSN